MLSFPCNSLLIENVQVQAVLLLLGGREIPTAVPTVDVPFDSNNKVILEWGNTEISTNFLTLILC